MEVTVSQAKGQLTDLVRRAESGDDIVLTRHGHPAVRLVPVRPRHDVAARRAFLEALSLEGSAQATKDGVSAARSQDFLYDEDGLPA
jgi:prevent-host-death family protein